MATPRKPGRKAPALAAVQKKLISERVADTLRDYVRAQRKSVYRLPSVAELSKQLGVSVVNVHRAVTMLRDEGLLDVVRGKGVFTRPAVQALRGAAEGPTLGVVCYSEKLAIDYLAQGEGFYNLVMRGVAREADASGHRLALHWIRSDFPQNPGRWPEIDAFCSEHGTRGLLLLCLLEEDLIEWIVGRGKPCVLVDHWTQRVAIDTVNPDNHGAAYAGTKRLIDQGHRAIAYCFHRKREMNPPRLQGYLDALRDAGIPFRPELLVHAQVTERGGEDAARKLLQVPGGFTALLTFDGSQGIGALNVLREQGKSVPVVTFGTTSASPAPEVTRVDLQPEKVGEVAIQRLLARIQDPALPAQDLTAPAKMG